MAVDSTVSRKFSRGEDPLNIRSTMMQEDGTFVDLEDGSEYGLQNSEGNGILMLAQRKTAEGVPDLKTNAKVTIPPGEWAYITPVAGTEYFVWVSEYTAILSLSPS